MYSSDYIISGINGSLIMRGNDTFVKLSSDGATFEDVLVSLSVDSLLSREDINERRWGGLNKYSNKSVVDLGVFVMIKGEITKEEHSSCSLQVFGDSCLPVTGVFDMFFCSNVGLAMREYERFNVLNEFSLTVTDLLFCSNGEFAKRVFKILGDSSSRVTGFADNLEVLVCINGEFAKTA